MPFDDFRRQIDARSKPSLEDIGACAERYGTSLTAATLRWLEYTTRRAVLAVSRDGFVLWSRSSRRALQTGMFFRTASGPPVPVPASSLASALMGTIGLGTIRHDTGVWFDEPCEEISLFSDRYEFAISLLHLEDAETDDRFADEPDELDTYEGILRKTPGSSWLS